MYQQQRFAPGALAAGTIPQFVCVGWDDNYFPDGMWWILDFLKNKKNADGSPARCSFYVNTNNSFPLRSTQEKLAGPLRESYLEAQRQGHEIGNHTATHAEGLRECGLKRWTDEIEACTADLRAIGIDVERINGFRAPFLLYNKASFDAIENLGFTYDCSIQSGFNDTIDDGRAFIWPYTLDEGVYGPDVLHGVPVGRHRGLWEVPAYSVVAPPELRSRLAAKFRAVGGDSQFDQANGKITGLDYNLWIDADPQTPTGLTADEYFETLRYSLDQRLAGNRAPLCFGAHTPLYDALSLPFPGNRWPEYHANASLTEMREAMERFFDYALSKPDVRVAPMATLVAWMEEPVGLR